MKRGGAALGTHNSGSVYISPSGMIASPYSTGSASPLGGHLGAISVPPTPQDYPISIGHSSGSIDSHVFDPSSTATATMQDPDAVMTGADEFDYSLMFDLNSGTMLTPELSNEPPTGGGAATADWQSLVGPQGASTESLSGSGPSPLSGPDPYHRPGSRPESRNSNSSVHTLRSMPQQDWATSNGTPHLNHSTTDPSQSGLGIHGIAPTGSASQLPSGSPQMHEGQQVRPGSRGSISEASRSKVKGNPRITKKNSRVALRSRKSRVELSEEVLSPPVSAANRTSPVAFGQAGISPPNSTGSAGTQAYPPVKLVQRSPPQKMRSQINLRRPSVPNETAKRTVSAAGAAAAADWTGSLLNGNTNATPNGKKLNAFYSNPMLRPPNMAPAAAAAALGTASGGNHNNMAATPVKAEPQSSPSTIAAATNTLRAAKSRQSLGQNVQPSPTPANRLHSTTKLVSEASESSPAKGMFSQKKAKKEAPRKRSNAMIPEMSSAMGQFQVELNVSPSVASAQAALNSAQASKAASTIHSMAIPAAQAAQANNDQAKRPASAAAAAAHAQRQARRDQAPNAQSRPYYTPGSQMIQLPPSGVPYPQKATGAAMMHHDISMRGAPGPGQRGRGLGQPPQVAPDRNMHGHPPPNWGPVMGNVRHHGAQSKPFSSAAGAAAMAPQLQHHQQPYHHMHPHPHPQTQVQAHPQSQLQQQAGPRGQRYNPPVQGRAASMAGLSDSGMPVPMPGPGGGAGFGHSKSQLNLGSHIFPPNAGPGSQGGSLSRRGMPVPPPSFQMGAQMGLQEAMVQDMGTSPTGMRRVDSVGSPLFSPPPVPRTMSSNVSPVPSRSDSLHSAQSAPSSVDEPLWLVVDQNHFDATAPGSRPRTAMGRMPSPQRQLETIPQERAPSKEPMILAQGLEDFKIDWTDEALDVGSEQWDMMGFLKPDYDTGY